MRFMVFDVDHLPSAIYHLGLTLQHVTFDILRFEIPLPSTFPE